MYSNRFSRLHNHIPHRASHIHYALLYGLCLGLTRIPYRAYTTHALTTYTFYSTDHAGHCALTVTCACTYHYRSGIAEIGRPARGCSLYRNTPSYIVARGHTATRTNVRNL